MPDLDEQNFTSPTIEDLNSLIPGYTFSGLISGDATGAVYLAQQESPERKVAIKVLAPALGENADFIEAFTAEFGSISGLKQSNIIKMYDFANTNGMTYIVMEYVNGKSLQHSNIGTIAKPKTAVDIIAGVCDGLEVAHQSEILHLDVKPSNIILNKLAVPKIGDFVETRLGELMQTGAMSGTAHYSAPEITEDLEKLSPATDLFSVGVIFYELLTGIKPEADYQSVANFGVIDKAFDDIIKKAIHPDVAQRYESVGEFSAAIKKVIEPSGRPAISLDTMRVSLVAPDELSTTAMAATMGNKSSTQAQDDAITAATTAVQPPAPLTPELPSLQPINRPTQNTIVNPTTNPTPNTPSAKTAENMHSTRPKNLGIIVFLLALLALAGAYLLYQSLNDETDRPSTEQSSGSSIKDDDKPF